MKGILSQNDFDKRLWAIRNTKNGIEAKNSYLLNQNRRLAEALRESVEYHEECLHTEAAHEACSHCKNVVKDHELLAEVEETP